MIKAVPFRRNPIRLSILLFLTGLFLSSCRTDLQASDHFIKIDSISYTNYNYERITFSCAPLDLETLRRIHGLNARYFTESPGLFPPRLPLVLDIQVSSERDEDVTLLYDEALLTNEEGVVYSSQTRREFYDLWEGKTAPSLRSRLSWLIDHNIHKKTIIISPHRKSRGYFLFLLNRTRRGEFTLTVPVVIDNQRGVLSLPVTLAIDPPPRAENPVPAEPVFIPDTN